MTMQFIASVTYNSNTNADAIFNSIPQTFTHLQLRIFGRNYNSGTLAAWYVYFNSDTGTNAYRVHSLIGNGSTAGSGNNLNTTISVNGLPGGGSGLNVFSATVLDLLDYTNTNKLKTVRWLNGYDDNGTSGTNAQVMLCSGLWVNSTNAITSIGVGSYNPNGNGWTAGSRIDLYGFNTSELTGA